MGDFEHYLEGYCKKHECTAEAAETHAICREVAEYYENPARYNIATITRINAGCSGAISGGDCK